MNIKVNKKRHPKFVINCDRVKAWYTLSGNTIAGYSGQGVGVGRCWSDRHKNKFSKLVYCVKMFFNRLQKRK